MTGRLLLPTVLAVLAVPPAVNAWMGDVALPARRPVPGDGTPPPAAGAPAPGTRPPSRAVQATPVAPPHPSAAAVIELLEDDAGRLARALNAGSDQESAARAGAWAGDCFSGASSLKVAGYQRYRDTLAGWAYPVVGNPRPGEYRYLRFAWKRPEGRGVMIQLCAGGLDWGRYFAGDNTVGFSPALQLSPQVPRDWQVVTRDLYVDFGGVPFTLTGMAFTSMDGVALFDHVYLGRTIEDLDKVTNAARSWARKTDFLRPAEIDRLWKDVGHEDAVVRQPAVWALGACGGTSVSYLADRVTLPDVAAVEKRIATAVADLDSPRFAVRERAHRDLTTLGPTALPQLETALKQPGISPEWRTRLEKLVTAVRMSDQVLTPDQSRTLRLIHILEMADTPEARELLGKLVKSGLEAGLSAEARGALERSEKRRK
jgi:hypothetical protein